MCCCNLINKTISKFNTEEGGFVFNKIHYDLNIADNNTIGKMSEVSDIFDIPKTLFESRIEKKKKIISDAETETIPGD